MTFEVSVAYFWGMLKERHVPHGLGVGRGNLLVHTGCVATCTRIYFLVKTRKYYMMILERINGLLVV